MAERWWTEDKDARLRALAEEGLSRDKIAKRLNEEFGVSLTRNAVCGRAHTLRVRPGPRGPATKEEVASTPKPRAAAASRRRATMSSPSVTPAPARAQAAPPPLPPAPAPARRPPPVAFAKPEKRKPREHTGVVIPADVAPPTCEPRPLVDIPHDGCRWPLGPIRARAELFCSAERPANDRVYCRYHRRMSSIGSQGMHPDPRPWVIVALVDEAVVEAADA